MLRKLTIVSYFSRLSLSVYAWKLYNMIVVDSISFIRSYDALYIHAVWYTNMQSTTNMYYKILYNGLGHRTCCTQLLFYFPRVIGSQKSMHIERFTNSLIKVDNSVKMVKPKKNPYPFVCFDFSHLTAFSIGKKCTQNHKN